MQGSSAKGCQNGPCAIHREKTFEKLSTPEHQKRMVTTNRLLPLGSLKRKTLKVLFRGWVEKRFKGCGPILTRKVAEATVRRLRSKLELPFLKVARKRLGPGKEKAMSTMDALETIWRKAMRIKNFICP